MTLVAALQQVRLSLNRGTALVEPPLSSELSGLSVPGINHSTAGTSALGMIWTTSTTTFHNPLLDLRDLVVHNLFNSDLLHDLRNIFCRHTVPPRGEPALRLPQSQLWIFEKLLEMHYNRHFHDLFTWLKLYPKHLFRIVCTCVSPSGRSHRRSSFLRRCAQSIRSFPDLLTSSLL